MQKLVQSVEWDYIIVGAGSAGCALARELAESSEQRVLVLESGGSDSSIFIKVPAGQVRAIRSHDWGYVSQPDPTRFHKTENWERGRVLGGSSSVNGMMYVRGAPQDFDRWASMGNLGWSYKDVLPLFREMECSDQPGELRGHSGPLSITTVRDPHPLAQAFLQSCAAVGLPFNRDYNGTHQFGASYAQLTQKNGFRCSSADAFLKPILHRHNIRLILNARVERLHLEEGCVTGVTYTCNGSLQTARALKVVLCAGALNSPQILMLSGIGDPEEIRKHGILVRHSLPAVGKNLREHPLLKMTYRTRIPSNNLTEGIGQRMRIAYQYLWRRNGPIANLFEAAAFFNSTGYETLPDVQLHFMSFGLAPGTGTGEKMLDTPSVTVLVNKNYPLSVGCVRLASSFPQDPPKIECRLLQERADLDTLVKGVAIVRKIMSAPPMRDLVSEEVRGGFGISDRGVSGFLPVQDSNRRTEIHEETETKSLSGV